MTFSQANTSIPASTSVSSLTGIGSLESSDRGSAARFNAGKVDLSLLDLRIVAAHLAQRVEDRTPTMCSAVRALHRLGTIQFLVPGVYAEMLQQLHGSVCDVLEHTHADTGGVEPFEAITKVFEYGRKKYAAWNWIKGMPWSAVVASCARHLMAIIEGEKTDSESGLAHAAHALCNIHMLTHYVDNYPEGNDLPGVFYAK